PAEDGAAAVDEDDPAAGRGSPAVASTVWGAPGLQFQSFRVGAQVAPANWNGFTKEVSMAALFRRDRRHPAVAFAQDHGPVLLAGVGAGAALAVFLDRGLAVRRRRVVERAGAVSRSTTGRMSRKVRDLRNRTRGA